MNLYSAVVYTGKAVKMEVVIMVKIVYSYKDGKKLNLSITGWRVMG